MKISIHYANQETANATLDNFTFPGGEQHIRLNPTQFSDCAKVEIYQRITQSAHILDLLLVVDALKRMHISSQKIELLIPYFPYARQDRVCVTGEALGAAVMANLINGMSFNKVTIWDAHSEVSVALLNNVVNIPQVELLKKCDALVHKITQQQLFLIAPDAGAAKKTMAIAQYFAGNCDSTIDMIQAHKIRDLKTGRIIESKILGQAEGKNILITDDICDGGRTFIELAKTLKAQGAKEISLFVTHGIFSKGLAVFEGLIDHIYCTDSIIDQNQVSASGTTTLTVFEI